MYRLQLRRVSRALVIGRALIIGIAVFGIVGFLGGGVSRPASAAPLVSVTYDVTGGSIFGPGISWQTLAPSAVTGGTLTFTLDTPISTPILAPGVPGAWSIVLTGVSGTFSVTGLAYSAVVGSLNFALTNVPLLPMSVRTGTTGGFPRYETISALSHFAAALSGNGSGGIVFKTPDTLNPTYYSHTFSFGNEVRVYAPVPEPSTAMLLMLGGALLAGSVKVFGLRLRRG